ncbi:MAG: HTH-type transcriptional activator CmpR [Firmicutes bacterium ADurb.Bin506]|jgi:DNA-binding transcriptional LysR family regulator|nr:MAG: HTH-type transcriptional activator CmpR [Firmicutes bacterium ADurb.Bin506]
MELRQLSIFLSTARHGSVTDAAKALFVSQPTVSLQIAALEKELGVVLFDRQSRGVELTEAGRILKRYADDILSLADMAAQAMGRYSAEVTGIVRAAASSVPADYVLPAAAAEFLSAHPSVMLELKRASSFDVVQQVLNYDVELGFVGSLAHSSELDAVPLLEDEIIIISAPCGDSTAWTDPVDLDTVLEQPMLCRELGSGTQKTFEDALAAAGVDAETLRVRARFESPEALKAAVACGAGIAAISALAAATDVAQGRLLAFRIKGFDMRRRFHMISHRRKVLSPATAAFRQHIVDKFALAAEAAKVVKQE